MSERYGVNAPFVASQVIDGVGILIDFESGAYFSADGSGALALELLTAGRTLAETAEVLASAYRVDAATTTGPVEAFAAELLEAGLLAARTESPAPAPDAAVREEPFAAPVLQVHRDLEDLLLLDPIHDVDAAGWPTAEPIDPAAPPKYVPPK